MIGRIWHGTVPVEKSDAYLEKMRIIALPGYRRVDGNRGAWVMHRIEGDIAHFDMLNFWDDVDAIKRFAGNYGSTILSCYQNLYLPFCPNWRYYDGKQ